MLAERVNGEDTTVNLQSNKLDSAERVSFLTLFLQKPDIHKYQEC